VLPEVGLKEAATNASNIYFSDMRLRSDQEHFDCIDSTRLPSSAGGAGQAHGGPNIRFGEARSPFFPKILRGRFHSADLQKTASFREAKCSLTSSAAVVVHVDLIPELVHDMQWPFNEPLYRLPKIRSRQTYLYFSFLP